MNYFFIINGTQLLNAIEYIKKEELKKSENILVLVCVTKLVWNDLNRVLKQTDYWNTILPLFPMWMLALNKYTFFRSLTVFYAKIKLKRVIKTPPKRIILGNYKNVFCKYVSKVNVGTQQIMVDDGPGTLDYFKNYKSKGSKSNLWIERFLNIEHYKVHPNVIFTRYFKQIQSACKDADIRLEQNSFNFLKNSVASKKKSEEFFFIGYPIIEENILDKQEYVKLLGDMKQKLGDLVYIPHRRETKSNLEAISKVMNIKELGMPFELYLFNSSSYPDSIVGFFTTIFFNVSEMFGEKIKLKYIKLNNLKITHISDLENLYDEISQIAEQVFAYNTKKISG